MVILVWMGFEEGGISSEIFIDTCVVDFVLQQNRSHFQKHILFHRIHAWYISLNINQHETSKSTNVPCRRTSPQNLPWFSQGWVVEELPTFPFGDWNHVEDDTETSLSAPLVAPSVSPKDASNTGGLPVSHTDVKNRGGLTMVNPTGSSPWPLGHAWNSRRPYVFSLRRKNASRIAAVWTKKDSAAPRAGKRCWEIELWHGIPHPIIMIWYDLSYDFFLDAPPFSKMEVR